MALLDWTLLVLYMVLTIGLGLWVTRGNKDGHDYLLGGGKLGWFTVGISLIATSMSASTFLGIPAQSYGGDCTYLMLQVGAFLSVIVVAKFYIPRYRAAGVSSAYTLLEQVYSRPVKIVASVFYCFHVLLRSGLLIYGPALVLSSALGISMEWTIVLTALLSMGYTAFGGLKAVVLTDTIQFFVLVTGVILSYVVLHQSEGLGVLWSIASEGGHTKVLPEELNLASLFDPTQADSLLSAMLVYAVLEIAIRGCDQQFVQRYLACTSTSSAVRSSWAAMLIGLPATLLFFGLGALLWAWYQLNPEALSNMGVNQAFPDFILNQLPMGLKGLLVAALLAASMSSFDSALNALNNTTLVDLLNRKPEDPKSLSLARKISIGWGLLALAAALFAAQAGQSLLYQALYFTSLFTGPLLAMVSLAFLAPSWRPSSILFGVFGGMLSLFLASPPGFLNWHDPWLSWPWNPVLSGCGAMLIAFLIQKLPSK